MVGGSVRQRMADFGPVFRTCRGPWASDLERGQWTPCQQSGPYVLWSNGPIVQWSHCPMVPLSHGPIVPPAVARLSAATDPSNFGTLSKCSGSREWAATGYCACRARNAYVGPFLSPKGGSSIATGFSPWETARPLPQSPRRGRQNSSTTRTRTTARTRGNVVHEPKTIFRCHTPTGTILLYPLSIRGLPWYNSIVSAKSRPALQARRSIALGKE